MTISKRTLTKWRREALLIINKYKEQYELSAVYMAERVLILTQELLDQQLLKNVKNEKFFNGKNGEKV